MEKQRQYANHAKTFSLHQTFGPAISEAAEPAAPRPAVSNCRIPLAGLRRGLARSSNPYSIESQVSTEWMHVPTAENQMPGIPIKPLVLSELQRQLNHELGAAHAYHAISVWCAEQHFQGFASFFEKQASEERLHAQKIIRHLLNRGILPELGSIPAPQGRFESILEVAKQAQSLEQKNTAGINSAYQVAFTEADLPAQVLLHWFINEQVEEEAWADELVARVTRAACSGGLSDLDRHIERYLGGQS